MIFNEIVADMIKNGRELAPSNHWNWNLGNNNDSNKEQIALSYTDDLFDKKYSQLEMMLNPWVGVSGMRPINNESVAKYEEFLKSIDHLELLPDEILPHGEANDWRETDLGSVIDISLISVYSARSTSYDKATICEVGGGYGRLAEAMLKVFPDSLHYVLLDVVPGSLMYAYLYLKNQLPSYKIGSYYNGDSYSKAFDCYIMPSWHAQPLEALSFDICINIESMQEMEQHHVDYYLRLFDRLTVPGGLIYLSNARDYVFRGKWNIPNHWESLFLNNTPRSWTADHPTHILHKKSDDYSLKRSILEGAFKQQITSWHERQLINKLKLDIADRDRICYELRNALHAMANDS